MVLEFGLLKNGLFKDSNARGEGLSAKSKDVLDGENVSAQFLQTKRRITAGTSFTFEGLSGKYNYLLIFNVKSGAGSNRTQIIINGDDVSNYANDGYTLTGGTFTTYSSVTQSRVAGDLNNSEQLCGQVFLSPGVAKRTNMVADLFSSGQGRHAFGCRCQFETEEINQIEVRGTQSFSVGSEVSLYRFSI